MSVDKDIATVLALEEPVQALLEAIKAARPAIDRLETAEYAGADWVGDNLDDDPHGALALPHKLASAVRMFRESAGDLAAFDYRFFVEDRGQTVGEGAKDILDLADDDEHVQRVVAMQQYAASAAR